MKVKFNPDGSIKLPERILKKQEENEKVFNTESSVKITIFQTSLVTPLECELLLQASNKLKNPERIEPIFKQATGIFQHMAKLSITKIDDKEYKVKIISGQLRCTWCEKFREFLGKRLNVKVITKGHCSSYTSSGKY